VYFLRDKGGRCIRLTTLPPSSAVVKKSGNLNFLEPSGPLQACNGAALPLPYPLNMGLGVPQSRFGGFEEDKKLLLPPGIEFLTFRTVA